MKGFRGTHIPGFKELLNLIIFLKNYRGRIVTLVNVFKKIFDGFDGHAYLNVDVAPIFEKKIGIVRHYPPIVKRAVFLFYTLTIITTTIEGIAIVRKDGM